MLPKFGVSLWTTEPRSWLQGRLSINYHREIESAGEAQQRGQISRERRLEPALISRIPAGFEPGCSQQQQLEDL
jgi:hypothetical protein